MNLAPRVQRERTSVDWVNQHRRRSIFTLIIALQVILVMSLAVREERLQRGIEIVLQSHPVDPRDPIRGDFVILEYQAEHLDGIPGVESPVGQWVYVVLSNHGRYWEPVEVRSSNLEGDAWSDKRVAIRALVVNESPLEVEYPHLGEYFVPQGTGVLPKSPDVHVSVSDDGTARIKYLEIDGLRWPFDKAES